MPTEEDKGILGPDAITETYDVEHLEEVAIASPGVLSGQIADVEGVVRLNLGAGDVDVDGYIAVDRRHGTEAYPLDCEDGSVDEIRASHILEHFGHRQVFLVLQHWVAKLKPGGRIRLAVPDFKWVTDNYLAGVPIDTQGYIMGGHTDANDKHGCIFDRESLSEVMFTAGLERITEWQSEVDDCASLDVSLNLQGFKPDADETPTNVVALMSAPRFGPVMHFRLAINAFATLGMKHMVGQGVYWQQVLTGMIEDAIAQASPEYIITVDYDSIFLPGDVRELCRLAKAYPDFEAIVAMQQKRGTDYALLYVENEDSTPKRHTYLADYERAITRVDAAHFGLSIFRVDAFAKLAKPWFESTPDSAGGWSDELGRVDADVGFWKNWKKSGLQVGVANRVPIGHLEETIAWPDKQLKAVYQSVSDYDTNGKPKEAWG